MAPKHCRSFPQISISRTSFLLGWLFAGTLLLILFFPTTTHAQSTCTNPYTVQSGDTWSRIVAKCNVRSVDLRAANPQIRNVNIVRIGQRINLPASADVGLPASSACADPYTVQSGDSFGGIAQQCNVRAIDLRAVNSQINDINALQVGQQLRIPSGPVPNLLIEQKLAFGTFDLFAGDSGTITLFDGAAQRQTDIGQLNVEIVGPTAIGDINRDGLADAATILKEQTGSTTGRFYSLHVMVDVQDAIADAIGIFLDDRIGVNSVQVQPTGDIVLDMFAKGPNDPLSGASLHVQRIYRLSGARLTLISETPVDSTPGTNPTVTPPPAPPTTTGCTAPYVTRLQQDARAHVLLNPALANSVRAESSRGAAVTGSIQPGEAMTLLSGPRCADGWLWWYVQADSGLVGWTGEGGDNGQYWLGPGDTPIVQPVVTATPTPTPAPAAECSAPYTTRLQQAGRAYVLLNPALANSVRAESSRGAAVTGSIQPGEAMTLLSGPRCADGWLWWYVQADSGLVGWTSEGGDNGQYWLGSGEAPAPQPVVTNTPTPAPPTANCSASYLTRLQSGGRAYVLQNPPVANQVRVEPKRNAAVIGRIEPGNAMDLTYGPRCADGWLWWYVQSDGGVVGWTSEGDIGQYWLGPDEASAE